MSKSVRVVKDSGENTYIIKLNNPTVEELSLVKKIATRLNAAMRKDIIKLTSYINDNNTGPVTTQHDVRGNH